ncbi:MAG: hypothetical protein HC915_05845 [Anaerolineae bacterium]|nr:hypothetical protein [Anaerolineae bacterium]
MEVFSGFPPGKQALVSVPALFFSELLPRIDHLGELKVTLYCLWAVQVQPSEYPHVRFSEACTDESLLRSLPARPDDATDALRESFERAVMRRSLLHVRLTLSMGEEDFFFINTERGRAAVEALQAGQWMPEGTRAPLGLQVVRPSAFAVYESSIGPLTPMIADHLAEALKEHGEGQCWRPSRLRWKSKFAVGLHPGCSGAQAPRPRKDSPRSTAQRMAALEAKYADLMPDDDE